MELVRRMFGAFQDGLDAATGGFACGCSFFLLVCSILLAEIAESS
jgi:hypothetical protein